MSRRRRGRARLWPVTPYQTAPWHDLFIALAGAAAALTGLIFVAVSINLAQILKYRALPVRAAETLSVLGGLLLLSVFVLVPGQSRVALGIEILLLGLVLAAALLYGRLRLPRTAGEPWTWTVAPLIVILAGTVPMIVAGISLLAAVGGGLYWLVAEVVLGLTGALANAWILLIEIQR
jgi:modulator of FtsH protease